MNADFSDVAQKARNSPFVWQVARRNMANANTVTRIRQDKIASLPAHEFEARSVRNGSNTTTYDIEVRYTPTDEDRSVDQLKRAMAHTIRTQFPGCKLLSQEAINRQVELAMQVIEEFAH